MQGAKKVPVCTDAAVQTEEVAVEEESDVGEDFSHRIC